MLEATEGTATSKEVSHGVQRKGPGMNYELFSLMWSVEEERIQSEYLGYLNPLRFEVMRPQTLEEKVGSNIGRARALGLSPGLTFEHARHVEYPALRKLILGMKKK